MEELKQEEWRQMPSARDYEVSSLGRVRSKRKIIKQFPNKLTKLLYVMTYTDKKPKLLNVSRQVCLAFHGNPPFPNAVARHISDDLQDNRVENVGWGTAGGDTKKLNDRWVYIIKQKTQAGLTIATYRGFDMLIDRGYKKESIIAAAHNRYMKDNRNVYKGYCWEVIKIKNSHGNEVEI